jgi:hypothetical protein
LRYPLAAVIDPSPFDTATYQLPSRAGDRARLGLPEIAHAIAFPVQFTVSALSLLTQADRRPSSRASQPFIRLSQLRG